MSWIQTYTGRVAFTVFEPKAEQIAIEDISHALALTCRFGGHSMIHYSVAQHSVLMASIAPEEYRLEALMHDAAEAYLGDMVRPLKLRMPEFVAAERLVEDAIIERFGLRLREPECARVIKELDLSMLVAEQRQVMSKLPMPWSSLEGVQPAAVTIQEMTWREADALFWDSFWDLFSGPSRREGAA